MKSFLTAGLALASGLAFAAVEKQTFNSAEVGDVPTGWTGDGKVAASGVSDRGNVLAIASEATCENAAGATAAQWATTSFIVQTPEDGTETNDLPPSTDTKMSDCQIAVATGPVSGENLKVMVYCKGPDGVAWTDSRVTVAKSSWMTVDINCDYTANKAQVVINGTPISTWFDLASTQPQSKTSKISSLVFVGSAQIDDVAIGEGSKDVLPENIRTMTIDLETLGVSLADVMDGTTKYGKLTVAERIEAGLAPKESSTFTATALAPAADGNLAITVPCAFDNGQAYEVYVNDVKVDSTKAIVKDGSGKITGVNLTFAPGTAKVLKVQVKAVAPSAPAPAAE